MKSQIAVVFASCGLDTSGRYSCPPYRTQARHVKVDILARRIARRHDYVKSSAAEQLDNGPFLALSLRMQDEADRAFTTPLTHALPQSCTTRHTRRGRAPAPNTGAAVRARARDVLRADVLTRRARVVAVGGAIDTCGAIARRRVGVGVPVAGRLHPRRVPGDAFVFGLEVQRDADFEERVDRKVGPDGRRGAVVRVEFEEVEEGLCHKWVNVKRTALATASWSRTHDHPAIDPPTRIVFPPPNVLVLFAQQASREFETRKCQCDGLLLERGKGAVQVQRHAVRGPDHRRGLFKPVEFGEFDHDLLGMAVAEVEAGCFEHEPLQADDGAGLVFKHLSEV